MSVSSKKEMLQKWGKMDPSVVASLKRIAGGRSYREGDVEGEREC